MPAHDWEDELLVRVATSLVRQAHGELAEALLESAGLAVTYGDSWWDGFDDYVHDVRVTLTAPANLLPVLTAGREVLRTTTRDVVSLFTDAQGSHRRGDLVGFVLVEDEAPADADRVERRRAALDAAPADREPGPGSS